MTLQLTNAGWQAAEQAAAAIPLVPTDAGNDAAAAAAHLADLGAARDWWEAHPAARRPEPPVYVNVRVHGATREEKLADLDAIAASWGVQVTTEPRLGTKTARLDFGGYTWEAHVSGPAKTMAELKAADARSMAATRGGPRESMRVLRAAVAPPPRPRRPDRRRLRS